MPAAKKLFTTIAVLLFLTGASCFAAEPEKDTAEIQLNFSDINKTLDGITKKITGVPSPAKRATTILRRSIPCKTKFLTNKNRIRPHCRA